MGMLFCIHFNSTSLNSTPKRNLRSVSFLHSNSRTELEFKITHNPTSDSDPSRSASGQIRCD